VGTESGIKLFHLHSNIYVPAATLTSLEENLTDILFLPGASPLLLAGNARGQLFWHKITHTEKDLYLTEQIELPAIHGSGSLQAMAYLPSLDMLLLNLADHNILLGSVR
jgi:hypothetical protein